MPSPHLACSTARSTARASCATSSSSCVPTLMPEDIVVMDNLGSHKAAAIRQALRAAGARLIYPAAVQPDLNPIEQAFSKLKHSLRTGRGAAGIELHENFLGVRPGSLRRSRFWRDFYRRPGIGQCRLWGVAAMSPARFSARNRGLVDCFRLKQCPHCDSLFLTEAEGPSSMSLRYESRQSPPDITAGYSGRGTSV